jgi:hypothetical protein
MKYVIFSKTNNGLKIAKELEKVGKDVTIITDSNISFLKDIKDKEEYTIIFDTKDDPISKDVEAKLTANNSIQTKNLTIGSNKNQYTNPKHGDLVNIPCSVEFNLHFTMSIIFFIENNILSSYISRFY